MRPLVLALTIPAFTQPVPVRTVSAMRDRYRPLLLFAPKNDLRMDDQLRQLEKHRSDLIDRHIMTVACAGHPAGPAVSAIVTSMKEEEEHALRRRFHIHPDDFTVILLGKDGGEKFRSHAAITVEQLNGIVDAMPMRQAERRVQVAP